MILGLDTCLSSCSVAVLDGDRVLASAREVMARGHQERLAPMARDVMAEAGIAFERLERIAVTVGPGSFTGLRVGVAFAKGLALALDTSTVGIGTLEALAAEGEGLVFPAVDARRGQLYLQAFEDGRALMAPDALTAEVAAARIAELSQGRPFALVGSGAALLADFAPGARVIEAEGADARQVARLAAGRASGPLKPLYLRAPDAKLPASALPA
ncbi:tRNA (adenosine(37)-N6)-threonylcarbamoyltransferase complex dimerization subunit type 1 TsaB [Phenylobacterium sp.]|uniref:tRNA (adenosine(37)-N6)-threonylcarbamoyltransferase complex dimerization subunit type 1 TsaB n=1 Tax=Phenylobacterium sp. TaxID=1871053 RepID=UPI0025E47126|nr:tRNA (adenosine(37)-N6)-threonylcarbamoyltransferase complex dimerization subunit type 1 TsaB [Phenylobacterium sp.]